jgi:hypothetical protein
MGEETSTSQPDGQESSEPPLSCSAREHAEPTLDTSGKAVKTIGSTTAKKEAERVTVGTDHDWQRKAQYAHILTIGEISQELQVDVQYVV